ncbi:MAG: LuxR C-terminal-related transcriptional regulator [Deltaproteobacteria bacterium]
MQVIKEKKKKALRQEKSLYLTLIEQSQDAIYVLFNGKLGFVNRKFSELSQITPEAAENPGFDFISLVAPESRPLIKERMKLFKKGEFMKQTFEFTALTVGGRRIEMEVSISNVSYKGGTATLGILHDITERKRFHERLTRINECFLSFVADPIENIRRLTCLLGEIMEATCALYNRIERGMLCSLGQWHTPPGYKTEDSPDGHICYDVIRQCGEQPLIIRNLADTDFARTDPNVAMYGLQTYIGQAVRCGGLCVGSLCVVYQKDIVPSEEDLKILGIIAAALGVEEERCRAEVDLKKSEKDLSLRSHNLEEVNTALKVLLKQRDEDKQQSEETILSNVNKLIVPYIERLKHSGLTPGQRNLTDIMEKNILEIVSPFLRNLSLRCMNLTPQEIQVAHLVKKGKTSKEIAELQNVSARTIDFHRENIRKKLGLRNKKKNLRSHLLSLL